MQYVEKELFPAELKPSKMNRRFYPRTVDIRNHMYIATTELRHSRNDQEDLQSRISSWEEEHPEDKFFFRASQEPEAASCMSVCNMKDNEREDTSDSYADDILDDMTHQKNCQNLLFVHQTKWPTPSEYGGEICLLDATYRTTRYVLPLFLVCVKTDVDYQVIASFICHMRTHQSKRPLRYSESGTRAGHRRIS